MGVILAQGSKRFLTVAFKPNTAFRLLPTPYSKGLCSGRNITAPAKLGLLHCGGEGAHVQA